MKSEYLARSLSMRVIPGSRTNGSPLNRVVRNPFDERTVGSVSRWEKDDHTIVDKVCNLLSQDWVCT